MTSLPAGDYRIYATCVGRATAHSSALLHEPDGMSAAVAFIMAPESVLKVKLNDAAGKPVERYEATAASTNSDCPTPNEADFTRDGSATIDGLPACDYKITARSSDGKSVSTTLHLDEGVIKEITLVLP